MAHFYAVVTPGLEPVTARELAAAGHPGPVGTVQPGGVAFEAPLAEGAALAAALRSPARLLVEVVSGPARSLDELAALTRRGAWQDFLRPGEQVEIAASARQSRLHFVDAVKKKVARAIFDTVGHPLQWAEPSQRVQIRLDRDQATISVDAGGELLHRRGWRLATAKAPLRENLAAAMLLAAGWTSEEALVDPFCGAGTLPIEAARLARGLPPGVDRSYAFQSWPALGRPSTQPSTQPRAPSPGLPVRLPILGSDRDAGAIRASTENAARAGVEVDWRRVDIRELLPPAPQGLVVANPPYGERVGGAEGGAAYTALGQLLRGPFAGWRALFLAPSETLARRVDRRVQAMTRFRNGGIPVGIWVLEP